MNENNPQSPDNKFTRRDFIRTTSTAAIGGSIVAAANAFAEDRSPTKGQGAADLIKQNESSDDTLKIALIGCGGRGAGAANQALSVSGKVKLVAVTDAF